MVLLASILAYRKQARCKRQLVSLRTPQLSCPRWEYVEGRILTHRDNLVHRHYDRVIMSKRACSTAAPRSDSLAAAVCSAPSSTSVAGQSLRFRSPTEHATMRSSRWYIHHKATASSDHEGQLRLESARIGKGAERTFEAFRFLRARANMRHRGDMKAQSARYTRGWAKPAMYVPWVDLAKEQYSGISAPPSVWRATSGEVSQGQNDSDN